MHAPLFSRAQSRRPSPHPPDGKGVTTGETHSLRPASRPFLSWRTRACGRQTPVLLCTQSDCLSTSGRRPSYPACSRTFAAEMRGVRRPATWCAYVVERASCPTSTCERVEWDGKTKRQKGVGWPREERPFNLCLNAPSFNSSSARSCQQRGRRNPSRFDPRLPGWVCSSPVSSLALRGYKGALRAILTTVF